MGGYPVRPLSASRRCARWSGLALLYAALVYAALLYAPLMAGHPEPVEGAFVLRNFRFRSGETLGELKLHYRTIGTAQRNAAGAVANAVLILHGTGGTGAGFLREQFAGELFGAGQLLDASRYFLILPDGLGHGGSSKPSDGMRTRFPRYGYHDMVEAQRRLLAEGLGVRRLRLIIGTSMGCMHAWMWGYLHPRAMDALLPLACLPHEISGRNLIWRQMAVDLIRNDPAYKKGNYKRQPPGLARSSYLLYLAGQNPLYLQAQAPTRELAVALYEKQFAKPPAAALDANDRIYQIEASRDYDPLPHLERIEAPVYAVNFADDFINPPELRILEREIGRVRRGRAVVVPASVETRGHGTHSLPQFWQPYLAELLAGFPAAGTEPAGTEPPP